MQVKLRDMRWEAERICSYGLEPLPGERLPPFTAGAHLELRLTDELSRCYSLFNDPVQRDRYEIAVHLAPESRGGSRHVHERWRPGDVIEIGALRNNFPLREDAAHTVLIGGGIGITPMLSMVARLQALGRDWELHYVARTRARAAFLDWLARYPQVRVTFDHEPGSSPLDLAAIVAASPPAAHLYCCGPVAMIKAFETLTAERPRGHVHVEYFTAAKAPATEGGYRVELRRSGTTIQVAAGQRMLDALLKAGVSVSYSCSEGVCGSCETRVLAGTPDHRDEYLTDEEKAVNGSVMPCCSGSKSSILVLDL
jgi:ferredoxin-NADP reductase